eukprot:TRINITY_DN8336_c0_g1_i14.p1 TRINITY_DN8336_c0_g1~~TRINITY_DN8336_c0_g1_i14.p1  ORF type:complete len:143 (-),score=4.56 TRINITY_DN8336_c0_g1_i14:36-464(-)
MIPLTIPLSRNMLFVLQQSVCNKSISSFEVSRDEYLYSELTAFELDWLKLDCDSELIFINGLRDDDVYILFVGSSSFQVFRYPFILVSCRFVCNVMYSFIYRVRLFHNPFCLLCRFTFIKPVLLINLYKLKKKKKKKKSTLR